MPQSISRPDLGEGAWLLVRRTYVCGDTPALQTMMAGQVVQLAPRVPGKPTIYEGVDGGFYFPDTSPVRDVALVDHEGLPEPHRSRAIAWVTGPGQTAGPMAIYTREQAEAAQDGDPLGLVYQQVKPAVNPPAEALRPPAPPARVQRPEGMRPPRVARKAQVRTVRPPSGPTGTRPAAADAVARLTGPPGRLPAPRGGKVIADEASLLKATGGVSVTGAGE